MSPFKILNGVRITTDNAQIAAELRSSFAASSANLETALRSLFQSEKSVDFPRRCRIINAGANRHGAFGERMPTTKMKPPRSH